MLKSTFLSIILLVTRLMLTSSCALEDARALPQELEIKSPDSKVKVNFAVRKGIPYYSVSYNDETLIKPSSLGFHFKDAPPLNGNFRVVNIDRKSVDETWEPVWGTTDKIRNHYNQLIIELQEEREPYRIMKLVFRTYNDGVGFRYILPEQKNLQDFNITSEDTKFRFAGDYNSFWIPADYDSYEHLYNETPLSEIDSANTPITMETEDGLCLSIHEADLTDYAGMTLKRVEGEPHTLESNLVPGRMGLRLRVEPHIPHPGGPYRLEESLAI